MKKKYAKTKLIIVAVLLLIGLCLTVLTFDIPGTSDTFLGFIGAMDSSTELKDSYKAVFTVDESSETVENSTLNEGVEIINDILTNYISGYSDVKVTRSVSNGQEEIIAYIPNQVLGESFISTFEKKSTLEAKTKNGAVVITNKNIESVHYTSDAEGGYQLYISFDKDGTAKLIQYGSDLTYTIDSKEATGQVYNNMLLITTSDISSSANNASSMTIALMAGKLPFNVTTKVQTIDGLVGAKTTTWLIVITIVMAVCYVVYMILRHRLLGLVSLLSAGIFVVVDSFIIQSISISSLSLASYLAILLSFVIYALGIEYQIGKMEKHYAMGKKLPISIKQGYKESLLPLMDLHITEFIAVMMMLIMGSRTLRAVSINMVVGVIISALITMLINKYFIKLLCDIYPNNAKKFNFNREEKVDEI